MSFYKNTILMLSVQMEPQTLLQLNYLEKHNELQKHFESLSDNQVRFCHCLQQIPVYRC